MAFNFNWSPLTADEDFYSRARDLLTKALNKSPKPPIIVDDILVEELNLGTVPPDLEILEIGDLAEDRFRGIFKMCYSGDAYLTLKTRVQANPLNTYLDSKPSFTSPKPLAAASGLTIPVTITLSDIKLSAFIILVFSKQKGLTLVFRNDPLESLKVSSTFDRIQFVRDYLQRTIEQQLRNLMMEELPAIIHRLSLQLWCPDQANKTDGPTDSNEEIVDEKGIDPFLSPPEDPVDAFGNLLDPNTVSEMTLHGGGETQSLFSQKNLLRLAALTDSHRTLSLFTPGIRDVVFRAWTGYGDKSDAVTPAIATPSLSRLSSVPGGASTTYTFSDTGSTAHGHLPSRPSLVSMNSATSGLALGAGNRSRPGRKKKTRVVNLRNRSQLETQSEVASDYTSDTASVTASLDGPCSEPMPTTSSISEAPEMMESSSENSMGKVYFTEAEKAAIPARHSLLSRMPVTPQDLEQTASIKVPKAAERATEKMSSHRRNTSSFDEKASTSSDTSSVHERAWINKMADEICRQLYDEKKRKGLPTGCTSWEEQDAPPAYEAATQ